MLCIPFIQIELYIFARYRSFRTLLRDKNSMLTCLQGDGDRIIYVYLFDGVGVFIDENIVWSDLRTDHRVLPFYDDLSFFFFLPLRKVLKIAPIIAAIITPAAPMIAALIVGSIIFFQF
jgi:hypothetical protein